MKPFRGHLLFIAPWALLLFAIANVGWGEADKETLTAEQESAALAFVAEHHPELSALLRQLKGMDQVGHVRALRDLSKAQERLALLKTRAPDRYEVDLAIWKIDSRVRLIAAQSVKGMDDVAKAQIVSLLTERNQLKIAQLQAERDRLAQRIEKLDATIQDTTESLDTNVERDLERIMKTIKYRSQQSKPNNEKNTKANLP